jgi:molybdate transport system permease protein
VDLEALGVSLRLAAATTVILLVVGVPIAAWLAFSRRRWTVVVQAVVALPLVLPPTVLGFYLLVALGGRSPLGRAWQELFGTTPAFSFSGLLLASVISSLPFAVQPLVSSFASIDRALLEDAAVLGVSRRRLIWNVVLPVSRTGLVTGGVLTFAHTLGEFGVVLMVGGNIPGVTRTASIAIYDSVQAFDYATAGRTSLLLLAISLVALVTTYLLHHRLSPTWTGPRGG